MSTIKMPKCCCCSVRTGLLIWIGLSVVVLALTTVTRNSTPLQLGINVFALVLNVLGFYATFARKRALVMFYGFIGLLNMLVGIGLGLWIAFAPETKEMVRKELDSYLSRTQNVVKNFNFDEIWTQAQLILVGVVVLQAVIQIIILVYVRLYYKYLSAVSKESKTVA